MTFRCSPPDSTVTMGGLKAPAPIPRRLPGPEYSTQNVPCPTCPVRTVSIPCGMVRGRRTGETSRTERSTSVQTTSSSEASASVTAVGVGLAIGSGAAAGVGAAVGATVAVDRRPQAPSRGSASRNSQGNSWNLFVSRLHQIYPGIIGCAGIFIFMQRPTRGLVTTRRPRRDPAVSSQP